MIPADYYRYCYTCDAWAWHAKVGNKFICKDCGKQND